MAGEIITSSTLPEAKEELREIYKTHNHSFHEITKEEYKSFEQDEREDSDNHLNEKRLEEESDVIDMAYYKFLPNRETAYRILLKNKEGREMEDYFIIVPESTGTNL